MRVLLAAVDPMARALWEALLADHRHDVVVTSPDLAGWDAVQASRPELAIIELPPGRPGALEFCRKLRRPGYEPRPRFIVLVHPDRPADMAAALQCGADDILVGQSDRRAAVSHLAALERHQRAPQVELRTAHDLSARRMEAAESPGRPAAVSERPTLSPTGPDRESVPLRTTLEALDMRLRAARHLVLKESAVAEEIHQAMEAAAALRRLLGLERTLPMPDLAVPHRDPTCAPGAPALTRRTILLIDDEALVRTPLSHALQRQGFHVLEAADGDEGLDVIARRGPEIALVVVDQKMPRVSGAEVLRQVRRRHSRLPVVLMSGQLTLMPADDAEGPDAFLLKPFQLADLAQTVQRLLGPEVAASA
jgi:DNA-binding response OmpR family regulator